MGDANFMSSYFTPRTLLDSLSILALQCICEMGLSSHFTDEEMEVQTDHIAVQGTQLGLELTPV